MQNKQKNATRPVADARLPFVLTFAIGAVALLFLTILAYLADPEGDLVLYASVLLAFDIAVCGILLCAYLFRVRHLREVQAVADDMSADIYDVFKYVIDLPYAVSDSRGNVKVINRAMQDILGLKSPICNTPLATFCSISIQDIIRSTGEPYELRHARALDAHGEVVPGAHGFHIHLGDRRYELFAHGMRLRGQDYYLITFHDVSDYLELREKMERENPIVAYIVLDNLQELAQYIRVSYRSA
ncbi:MAG: hypothetical protein IIX15_00595, partial [Clostridia bacterium]|nr:hypothetical protein [Clostridia bacterium]